MNTKARTLAIALATLGMAVAASPRHTTRSMPIDTESPLRPVARSVQDGPLTSHGAFRVHAIEPDRAFRLLPWDWQAEGTLVLVVTAPPGDHGLRAGDLVLRIGNDPVGGVESLEAAARRSLESDRNLPLLIARSHEVLPVSVRLTRPSPDDRSEITEAAPPEDERVEVRMDGPATAEKLPPEFRAAIRSEEGAGSEPRTPSFFEEVGLDEVGPEPGSLKELQRRFEEMTVAGEPVGGPDPDVAVEIEEIVRRYRSGTVDERMEAVLDLRSFTYDWGLEILPHFMTALGDPDEGVRLAAAVVLVYDVFGGADPEGDRITQSVLSAAILRPEPPLRDLASQATANMFEGRFAEPVLQEALVAALLDEDGEVTGSAQWALDALAY